MLYNTSNIQCSLIETNVGIKCCVSFLKSNKQFFDFFNIFDVKSLSIQDVDKYNQYQNKKNNFSNDDKIDINIDNNLNSSKESNINFTIPENDLKKKEYHLYIFFNDGKSKCLAVFLDEDLANMALNDLQSVFFQVMHEKSLDYNLYNFPTMNNINSQENNINKENFDKNFNNSIIQNINKKIKVKNYIKKIFKNLLILLLITVIFFIGYLVGVYRTMDFNKLYMNQHYNFNNENSMLNDLLNNNLENFNKPNALTFNSPFNQENNKSNKIKNLKPFTKDVLKEIEKLSMIKFNGENPDLYIFSDLNCGACKRLDEILSKTKISYAIIPVATLGEDSAIKALKVNCAKDKPKAWKRMLKNDMDYFKDAFDYKNNDFQYFKKCSENILDNLNFFTQYQFLPNYQPATPTIITKKGNVNIGVPNIDIEKWVKEN